MADETNDFDGKISIQHLYTQIKNRKEAQKARNARMDYWHLLYLLIDQYQLSKPPNLIRFTSNEPQTVVDLGAEIIARNPLQARIPMEAGEISDPDMEQKKTDIGMLEKGAVGAFREIDRRQNKRGLPSSRKTAAYSLLLRGWVANRLEIRDEAHPLDFDSWDMRFVLPEFSRGGLESVINESTTTWGDILRSFPEYAQKVQRSQPEIYSQDLEQQVVQYEFWDTIQYALAVTPPRKKGTGDARQTDRAAGGLQFVVEPKEHGYVDEEDVPCIPVVIVPSHGLPFQYIPSSGVASGQLLTPADVQRFNKNSNLPIWKRPGGWTGDQGRSILSAVEDTIPQFNEVASLIWQIMDNEAFGTINIKTRTGAAREFSYGGGSINFFRVGEGPEKMGSMTASPDTYRMLEFLNQQLSQGSLDQKILRGLQEFTGSGFLRSQMENAALNALGPWVTAYNFWASENAQLMFNQLRKGSGRAFTVLAEGSDRRLFKVPFGPDAVKEVVYIEMKAKPALPDDLAVRVNIAAQLLNPARPMASIQTVFDRVLEWEDAEREKKLIFDDLADLDPVVVLLRLRSRMMAQGMEELADLFGERAFATAFIEKATQMQMMQSLSGAGMQGADTTQTPPATPASTAPPETYGNEPAMAGVAPTPAGGAEGAV